MWISKKKYEELVCRLNRLERKVSNMPEELNKCRDDINDIQRVMEESKLGEITYKSIFDKTALFFSKSKDSKNYTLIYKDFKEYKICGLYLNKPQFEIDEKDNNLYTKKIVSPIYTPTGNKPAISELYNLETYNCLMKQIQECNLDKQTKDFLQIAASRHIVFDYGKIAEFYAHSNNIIQNLMENSALVIIDFNKAIELGYVCLKKELSDSYLEDYSNDEK